MSPNSIWDMANQCDILSLPGMLLRTGHERRGGLSSSRLALLYEPHDFCTTSGAAVFMDWQLSDCVGTAKVRIQNRRLVSYIPLSGDLV